eukprot:jgi/Mesvir1/15811/Mv03367-RA.1
MFPLVLLGPLHLSIDSSNTKLRAEAVAPFRAFRMFFFQAFSAAAALAAFITIPRVIKAANGVEGLELQSEVINLGIDIGVLLLLVWLYQRDDKGVQATLAKMDREEELGECRLELGSGRVVTLEQLRTSLRVVLVAGSEEHCRKAIKEARTHQSALMERGVLVVPLVLPITAYDRVGGFSKEASGAGAVPLSAKDIASKRDKRFLAVPIAPAKWASWVQEQKEFANTNAADKKKDFSVDAADPVYVCLRMDGRVRSSGKGMPNWGAMATSLPSVKGVFKGFLDGMDGAV